MFPWVLTTLFRIPHEIPSLPLKLSFQSFPSLFSSSLIYRYGKHTDCFSFQQKFTNLITFLLFLGRTSENLKFSLFSSLDPFIDSNFIHIRTRDTTIEDFASGRTIWETQWHECNESFDCNRDVPMLKVSEHIYSIRLAYV